MKLVVGVQAKKKIDLLQKSDNKINGFLIGSKIAKYTIISDLFLYGFNKDDFSDAYRSVYENWGFKLKGFFYRNTNVLFDDYFYEKIIMEINENSTDCYFCRIDCNEKSKRKIEKMKYIFI